MFFCRMKILFPLNVMSSDVNVPACSSSVSVVSSAGTLKSSSLVNGMSPTITVRSPRLYVAALPAANVSENVAVAPLHNVGVYPSADTCANTLLYEWAFLRILSLAKALMYQKSFSENNANSSTRNSPKSDLLRSVHSGNSESARRCALSTICIIVAFVSKSSSGMIRSSEYRRSF